MSESDSDSGAAKPARKINRWGAGTLSVLQVALLAVLLIALNYLSAHHFKRLDLSREGNYTLSSKTVNYLGSKELAERPKPVKWIMAFRRSSPFYERVRAIAEEYERLSGGRIDLDVVDPLRSSDRAQEVTAAYGLPLTKDLLIIDARTDSSLVSTEQPVAEPIPALNPEGVSRKTERILNPHIKIVLAEDLAVYKTADNVRRITGFQGEDVLTARLVEAIEGRTRKMLFLSDKTSLPIDDENSPLKSLNDLMVLQNVELKGVSLAGMAEIPADTEAVALVAPKYDLTEDELKVLENYWNRPRAALLVLLSAGETPPRLRTFLRANGVTPRNDRVIARVKDRIDTTARGNFGYKIDFIKDLAGQGTVLDGATSSLEVREGASDLMNRQIFPMPLIQADKSFWGETRFGTKDVAFNETEDHKPPLDLAASITRGAANNDEFAGDTSRMVIIANTDFLSASNQRAENMDFLASSVNWLMDRQSLAGIGPRSLGTYKLPILEAQVSFINRVNLFFLPAFLLLAGALVWSSRRA